MKGNEAQASNMDKSPWIPPKTLHTLRTTDNRIGRWFTLKNRLHLDYTLQFVKFVNIKAKGKFMRSREDKRNNFNKDEKYYISFILCIDTKHILHILTARGAEVTSQRLSHDQNNAISSIAVNSVINHNEFIFVVSSTDGVNNAYKFNYDTATKVGIVNVIFTTKFRYFTKKTAEIEYATSSHINYKKTLHRCDFIFSTSKGRNILYKGTIANTSIITFSSIIDDDDNNNNNNNNNNDMRSNKLISNPIIQSFQFDDYFVYMKNNKLVIKKESRDENTLSKQTIFDIDSIQKQIVATNEALGTFANGTIVDFVINNNFLNLYLISDFGYISQYKLKKGNNGQLFQLTFTRTYRYVFDTIKSINHEKNKRGKKGEIVFVDDSRYMIQSKRCSFYIYDPRFTHYLAKIDATSTYCYNDSERAYKLQYNKDGFGGIRFAVAPDYETYRPTVNDFFTPATARFKDTLLLVAHNTKRNNNLKNLFGGNYRLYKGSIILIYRGTEIHESFFQNFIDMFHHTSYLIIVVSLVCIRYLSIHKGNYSIKRN